MRGVLAQLPAGNPADALYQLLPAAAAQPSAASITRSWSVTAWGGGARSATDGTMSLWSVPTLRFQLGLDRRCRVKQLDQAGPRHRLVHEPVRDHASMHWPASARIQSPCVPRRRSQGFAKNVGRWWSAQTFPAAGRAHQGGAWWSTAQLMAGQELSIGGRGGTGTTTKARCQSNRDDFSTFKMQSRQYSRH